MAEQTRADIYIAYLEQILAGEKDIGPVEDVEIEKLLQLAKTMLAADLSVNSEMKDNLIKQLLAQVTKKNKSNVLFTNDDELDEEDLNEVVAAGSAGQAGEQKENCPYCGSRSIKLEGKCPLCSH